MVRLCAHASTWPASIMDGNHRWARQMGLASPSLGRKYGAEHVEDVLQGWQRAGISHVTVFVCSAENLQRRGDAEIAFLMQVIEDVVADRLARRPYAEHRQRY
jgi:short-chain Z-isoprenyl diphosphate synthase